MWLSNKGNKNNIPNSNEIENANLTISTSDEIELNGSSNSRNIRLYSPYGYSYVAPSGIEGLIMNASFGKAVAGLRMPNTNLKSGEIKISNSSGAYILLRNDGLVEINGKTFEKDGTFNDTK